MPQRGRRNSRSAADGDQVHWLVHKLIGEQASVVVGKYRLQFYRAGRRIEELQTIAWSLARRYPKAGPLPTDAEGETRVIEAMDYAVLDSQLAVNNPVVGGFSIADAALFHVNFWHDSLKLDLPPNRRADYPRMLGHPAVQRVLREEGYRV